MSIARWWAYRIAKNQKFGELGLENPYELRALWCLKYQVRIGRGQDGPKRGGINAEVISSVRGASPDDGSLKINS